MSLEHINPSTMHHNPAFSQGVLIEGPGRLLVIGGQNGVGADGQVVSSDFGDQTRQALRNLLTVLAEVGANQENVAKMTIFYASGQDVREGFAASAEVWGAVPTAITVIQVPSFARPDVLVEIDALAQVPEV